MFKKWINKYILPEVRKEFSSQSNINSNILSRLDSIDGWIRIANYNLPSLESEIKLLKESCKTLKDDVVTLENKLVDSVSKVNSGHILLETKLSNQAVDVDYKLTGLNKVVVDRLEALNLAPKHTAGLMRRIAELEGKDGSKMPTLIEVGFKRDEYAKKLLSCSGALQERYQDAVNLLDWVLGKEV